MTTYGALVRTKGALLSNLFSCDDLHPVLGAGADEVLVGKALMRQPGMTAAQKIFIGM